MNKIQVFILVAAIIVVAVMGILLMTHTNKKFGVSVANDMYNFVYGFVVGTPDKAGCIKMYDYSGGGTTYISTLNGVVSANTNSAVFGSGVCYFPGT